MLEKRSGFDRRAFNARAHPHVSERSAKAQHSFCDRFFKRQRCGSNPSLGIGQETGIGPALLGQRILCQYRSVWMKKPYANTFETKKGAKKNN
jgi:hypothetical protein